MRFIRLLFLGGVLLILLWMGLKTWRIAQAARALQDSQVQAAALMEDGFTRIDPDAADALVMDIRRNVLTLKRETAVFLPLAPHLGWLPKVGPTLVAAPHLLDMADAGTEAAAYAVRGLKPALVLLQDEEASSDSRIADLVQVLDTAEPDLIQTSLALERVAAARVALGDGQTLPWRVRSLLALADEWLPLAQDGLKLAPVLPEIMGSQGLRRYLILAQNEDELRPTGGFISGVGLIAIEDGRIIELGFQDTYQVDNWREKPYDLPPQPLYEFMLSELFLFRDTNFWPDFPTSAEKAMELYAYGQDTPPLDGIIAVDQRFVQLLVEGVGPIPIPNAGITLTRDNVIENFRAAWSVSEDEKVEGWWQTRKDFMGTFASAIRTRLESDLGAIDPAAFVRSLYQAAQTKHVQIYMRDPAVAAVLDELNWDGRLEIPPQDFLMVVDTNVGFNKVNIFIERAIDYHVRLAPDGSAEAELSLSYGHTGPQNGKPCSQGIIYSERPQYLEIADKCYWNYLRVYAPAGSRLLESSRHTVPGQALLSRQAWDSTAETINDESGLTAFANLMLVARGQNLNSSYHYQLPEGISQSIDDRERYQLVVAKQAGTDKQPLQVTVTLPESAQLIDAHPKPTAIEGRDVTFKLQLEADKVITVTYEIPKG